VNEGGQPVAGASVSVIGRSATTAADGTFSMTGVPTSQRVLVASAMGTLNGVIVDDALIRRLLFFDNMAAVEVAITSN